MLVSLLAAVIILGVLIFLLWWIRKNSLAQQNFGIYPRISLSAQLIGIILSAMFVMATMSDALFRMNIIQYVADKNIDYDQFLNYYGWHLLDSIPVLQITKNFNVSLHVTAETSYELESGFLLLVFKVVIITLSINLFGSKRKNLHRTSGAMIVLKDRRIKNL